MKKILALVLAVAMCVSTGVLAFAASDDKERTDVVFLGGSTSDTFSGVAVPGKNSKTPILLVAAADNTALATAVTEAKKAVTAAQTDVTTAEGPVETAQADVNTAQADVNTAQADVNTAQADVNTATQALEDAKDARDNDTNSIHDPAEGTPCSLCDAVDDAQDILDAKQGLLDDANDVLDAKQGLLDAANVVLTTKQGLLDTAEAALTAAEAILTAAEKAVTDSSSTYTVLSQTQAWKAYDTDKAFKLTFKATKGADYIKSWEIKKTTAGEMYVQVNYNEYYLGGMKDVAYEITLTVTNNTKFNARLSDAAVAAKISFARSEYVKFERLNLKYGFNGGNVKDPYKDYEIKAESPTDYDIIANLDNDNGTGSTHKDSAGKTVYDYDTNTAIHYKKGSGEVYSFDYGNGNAYFEVKMDNQAVVNLYMSTSAIKALTSAYPDAEMLFWDWRGNPELDFTATVELYYDEDDVGDDPYLYKWDGSVLTEVSSAEFEDETCTFRTRALGAYVISDVELDTSIVSSTTAVTTEIGEATEAPEDGGASGSDTKNPDTGASDFVSVAIAMAVVSLAAAGALTLKK